MLDHCITEEMLADVLQQFMQELQEVHTTTEKKIWKNFILPSRATLLTMGILFLLGWALKVGKLKTTRKYTEKFTRISHWNCRCRRNAADYY